MQQEKNIIYIWALLLFLCRNFLKHTHICFNHISELHNVVYERKQEMKESKIEKEVITWYSRNLINIYQRKMKHHIKNKLEMKWLDLAWFAVPKETPSESKHVTIE